MLIGFALALSSLAVAALILEPSSAESRALRTGPDRSNPDYEIEGWSSPIEPTVSPVGLEDLPQSQTVYEGDAALFAVALNRYTPFGDRTTYQWWHDGIAVPGASNMVMLVSNAQPANAGQYWAGVTNPVLQTNSRTAALVVQAARFRKDPTFSTLVRPSLPKVDGNPRALALDSQDNLLLIEETRDPDGSNGTCLAKYGRDGGLQWQLQGGPSHWAWPSSGLITDDADNTYFFGAFGETVAFGDLILTNHFPSSGPYRLNFFLAKLDRQGQIKWGKCPDQPIDSSTTGLMVDQQKNVFVSVFERQPTNWLGFVPVNGNLWLKFDVDGQLLWAKDSDVWSLIGRNRSQLLYCVSSAGKLGRADLNGQILWQVGPWPQIDDTVATADGSLFVMGSFQGQATFGTITLNSPFVAANRYLVKMDSTGKVLWARSLFSELLYTTYAWQLSLGSQSEVYVSGPFLGRLGLTEGPTWNSSGGSDLALALVDANGHWGWTKHLQHYPTVIESQGYVGIDDCAADRLGNFYFSGQYDRILIIDHQVFLNPDRPFLQRFTARLTFAPQPYWMSGQPGPAFVNGIFSCQSLVKPGLAYSIEASTDLRDWTRLQTIASTNGGIQFTDSKASDYPRRFYRLAFP
jgi:hypothetical protein